MNVRIWFVLVLPVIFFGTGIAYYVTRSTPVAMTGGIVFLAALFVGWYLAGSAQKS